jgi:Nuclease-related domain
VRYLTAPDIEGGVKEDVLEQIVDDYLQMKGYFTIHNVRFRPSADHVGYQTSLDSVSSDIDVVAIHPRRTAKDRVVAVSCKAWQTGFYANRILAQLKGEAPNPKRPRWLQFRELWDAKWSVPALTSDSSDLLTEIPQGFRVRRPAS